MCPRAVYDLGWSTFLSSSRQAVPPCSWLSTMLAALSSQSIQTAGLQTVHTARTHEAAQRPTTNRPVCFCNLVTVVEKYSP